MAEKTSWYDKAKQSVQKAGERVQPLASRVAKTTGDAAAAVNKKYHDSGAHDKVSKVTGKVSEKFDVVSGQAMYQAVQERLARQDEFNNVLANKLVEALERIQGLEQQLEGAK
jgi:hypothetical protein